MTEIEEKQNYIVIDGVLITSCGKCSMNISEKNPIFSFLPPVHRCKAKFEVSDPKGRLLFNPNIIPDWCPVLDRKV